VKLAVSAVVSPLVSLEVSAELSLEVSLLVSLEESEVPLSLLLLEQPDIRPMTIQPDSRRARAFFSFISFPFLFIVWWQTGKTRRDRKEKNYYIFTSLPSQKV
jgi:hypothetical protein